MLMDSFESGRSRSLNGIVGVLRGPWYGLIIPSIGVSSYRKRTISVPRLLRVGQKELTTCYRMSTMERGRDLEALELARLTPECHLWQWMPRTFGLLGPDSGTSLLKYLRLYFQNEVLAKNHAWVKWNMW